jgi:hypothetical protein
MNVTHQFQQIGVFLTQNGFACPVEFILMKAAHHYESNEKNYF